MRDEGKRWSVMAGVLLSLMAVALPAGEDPDMAMIEFLGEFTGEEGDWVDPMDLYLLEQEAGLLDEAAEPSEDEAAPEEESDEQNNR